MPKRIALLGSTGSIGTQALDVISRFPDEFSVGILTAGNNIDLLIQQTRKYLPEAVAIANRDHFAQLREMLGNLPVKVYAGMDEIEHLVAAKGTDIVIASMVGYSGLKPVLSAIESGKDIALANKETLVVAGKIMREAAVKSGSRIIPVDSEHSAILQCLTGEQEKSVEMITLTASGGPFLNYTLEELESVRPEDALRHPNWDMGNKITIDSATMMNKGLEVIEATWLFNLSPGQVKVVIHPQSIIHSFVHFTDGSVKAQLGIPDMRLPILYSLSYPERLKTDLPRLDFSEHDSFNFFIPDMKKFRNLSHAYYALKMGGNVPCLLNAANEVAVSAFLDGRITFLQMPDVVEYTMQKSDYSADLDFRIIEASDYEGRKRATEFINQLKDKK